MILCATNMATSICNTLLSLLSANWFAISLTVCISFILYIWGIAPFRRSRVLAIVGDLPGPSPKPFVGNFLGLIIKAKGQIHLHIDAYYKKYGRLFTMFLFTKTPSLIIGDPEMTKEILVKEFQNFHDRTFLFELPKPFDVMMSIAPGEKWHRIRTTLTPTFSAHKMKLMIPLMNKSCDLLEKKLDQVAGTGETIDIFKYYQGLTMEGILSTFFGIESNAQNDYDDPAFKAGRESLDPGPARRFITAMLGILPFGSYVVRYFPTLFIGQFQNLFHLAETIIEARKKDISVRKDVLDLMLSATQPDVAEHKTLSEVEVIAQSMMFLFAGYETTSNTLAFVSHHLATNPDFQEKLQKEIDEVWSEEDQPPSYEVVQSLPYLDMVISETLRLYPPGFFLTRECTKDCVIKGLHIKKGTPIFTPVYSIHRDPEFYPDPEKFDPERFSAEAKASRDPYTYLPFGHGPRNCIGMRFAQMEMKLALVHILKRFTLVVAPETKIPPVIIGKPTILGCDGVNLRIQYRKQP